MSENVEKKLILYDVKKEKNKPRKHKINILN